MFVQWIFLLVVLAPPAKAHFQAELSRDFSDASYSNNVAVGAGFGMNMLSYSYSNALTRASLNPNLSDFDISYDSHSLGYQLSLPAGLVLDADYSRTTLNKDEALTEQYSGGAYFRAGSFQFGYSHSQSKTSQQKDLIVLTRNFKDEMKFIQTADSYHVDFQWSDSLLTILKYTYYSYNENLDNFNALLTTQAFLNKGSASVANEVQTQMRYSADFNIVYMADYNWLFNLAVGTSQESLSPSDHFNEARMGAEYEMFAGQTSYKFFYNISGSKNRNEDYVETSHFAGIGIDF